MRLKELNEGKSCKYCKKPATKKTIWADGRGGLLTCDDHVDKARDIIVNKNNDKVEEVISYEA